MPAKKPSRPSAAKTTTAPRAAATRATPTQPTLAEIRHSLAHVMASAVLELFPEAKIGVGPVIETGFYYDFDLPRTLTPEDLPVIEEKMRALIAQDLPFERTEVSAEEARAFFSETHQDFKVELIDDLTTHGTTAASKIHELQEAGLERAQGDVVITTYATGAFRDLCRGPHVASTGQIDPKSFRLTTIAGAYWRGSEKRPMLQRIYGAAFETEEELARHFAMLEEAKKRDHRRLGKELDLFHVDDVVGLGLPLWHPKGARLWRTIEDFWYAEHLQQGYELVRSPHIGNRALWETSGHWGFYSGSMYPPLEVGQTLEERKQQQVAETSEEYLLKPMNCPFHVQIYKHGLRSYRDLPFRWAECGTVYRYEKRGELNGLTRVRGFTQDDAHIICRKDQVVDELKRVVDFTLFMYESFGFAQEDVAVYLSLRDPVAKDKYAGDDAGWAFTEDVLRKVAIDKGLRFKEELGEAAFYGPKLDFKIRDCIGREWQCTTLQFDFNLPERFNMTFVNASSEEERPYMLHRALFGSYERFIGLLIEHYAGAFPLWLAPVQVRILTINEKVAPFADDVLAQLRGAGLRAEIDDRNESLGKKVRDAELQKIPHALVIGEKEAAEGAVTLRRLHQKEQAKHSVADYIASALEQVRAKA